MRLWVSGSTAGSCTAPVSGSATRVSTSRSANTSRGQNLPNQDAILNKPFSVTLESQLSSFIFSLEQLGYANKFYRIGLGSGGGSIGRAVAFDTRDPQSQSQHRQSFIY